MRVEKLIGERLSRNNFQKRKGFNFVSGQSLKESKSSNSSSNSSGSRSDSISSPQSFRSLQLSKLGTSPPDSTLRGRMMTKRYPYCKQFHTGTCGKPQVCFHYGQTGHVKRFCLLLSGFGFVGKSSSQPRALV